MEKELNIPEGTEVTEPLKIYLNEIGQIPLLDAEEEKELRFAKAEQILRDAGADYVIRTMRELPDVIKRINEKLEAM